MDVFTAAGTTAMLAHEGQAQIAAALIGELRRVSQGVLAWLGRSRPPAQPN